jgi:GNAT superfamily N-acetyltransferase
MSGAPSGIEIRAASTADRPDVLRLLSQSLHWVPNELFERFFRWKHEENPFGASPMWVACDGTDIVGFRAFLRWEFDHPDRRVRRAVRAVDTATHPDYRGRGVFRRLTLHALGQLRDDGVDFVFNTPNEQSRPGYLKMGWRVIGHLPTAVRPRGLAGALKMARARVPAERWSLPTNAGVPADAALADPRLPALLAARASPRGLRTRVHPAYLQWRYGFAPLAYRALAIEDDPAAGTAIFRMRRRGAATEATLCDVLVPAGDLPTATRLARAVGRTGNADYAIRIGGPTIDRAGFVRLPRQGPILTWRAVCEDDAPPRSAWQLGLGDVELF